MFGILKKKISSFGSKLKKNVKEKEEQTPKEPILETKEILEPSTPPIEIKEDLPEEPIAKEEVFPEPTNDEDTVLAEIRKEIEEENKE